jgi:hypothetical protein
MQWSHVLLLGRCLLLDGQSQAIGLSIFQERPELNRVRYSGNTAWKILTNLRYWRSSFYWATDSGLPTL